MITILQIVEVFLLSMSVILFVAIMYALLRKAKEELVQQKQGSQ